MSGATTRTVVVLRTGDLAQLAVARSLLEAHGISCATTGEQTVGLLLGAQVPSLFGLRKVEAELRVPEHCLETARDLLEIGED